MKRRSWLIGGGLVALAGICAVGCRQLLPLFGYPPEALRDSAPEGIRAKAIAVGKPAPPLTMADGAGAPSTQGEVVLNPGQRHIVVFYRGHW